MDETKYWLWMSMVFGIGNPRIWEVVCLFEDVVEAFSSLKDEPIREDTLAVGEIGLGGELRTVSFCEQRIKEADRLGFKRIIVPKHNLKKLSEIIKGEIEIIGCRNVNEAYNASV